MTPTVELKEISRAFADRMVLRRIDLTVAHGEALVITGPNGAGKTTLLRIIGTLLSPNSGLMHLFGERIRGHEFRPRRKIGALFMESYLYGNLTVRENLLLYARIYDLPQPNELILTWLERVGMERFRNEQVNTLSRGERQRISLVRSLFHNPKLLLWDEPTTGLDVRARALLNDFATDRKGKCTIICATHDPDAISAWIDREARLEGGKLS